MKRTLLLLILGLVTMIQFCSSHDNIIHHDEIVFTLLSSSKFHKSIYKKLRGGGSALTTSTSTSSSPYNVIRRPHTGQRNPLAPSSQQQTTTTTTTTVMPIVEDEKIAAKEMMEAFLTRDSRNNFISRVYAILACQLLVTAGSIGIFGMNPNLVHWMHRPGIGTTVPILSLLISTIAWIIMCVSTQARRASPIKWQILTLFTIGEAISVGFISSFYKFQSVISAMTATALATSGVSIYTILQRNSKYDLSQWGATLSSFGLIFVVYGIIQLLQMTGILPANFLPYNEMLYGLIGATIFSFYLAYHTRLIVAGKHTKYRMNEKDYIFGAMTLYNDIINMFIYILRIIGEDKDR